MAQMDEARQQIALLMQALRLQTQVPLWSLANQNLLFSIATAKKPQWGPRSRLLLLMMKVAYRLQLSDLILFLVGASSVFFLRYRLLRRRLRGEVKMQAVARVFAGFGAASEEYLYADYASRSSTPLLRINWVTGEGLNALPLPSLFSVLFFMARNIFQHTKCLKKSTLVAVRQHLADFLVVGAQNVGAYAFYRAYWQVALQQGVKEVALLAQDMPTFAAVDAGVPTVFLQHGLLAMSVLLSDVQKIEALTEEEAAYFSACLKNVTIVPYFKKNKTVQVKSNSALFLLPSTISRDDLKEVTAFVLFAEKCGLAIIMRPSPITDKIVLKMYQEKFAFALWDDLAVSLTESIECHKPQWVGALWSTGLASALQAGFLPISFDVSSVNVAACNMIYPLKKRALFWPKEQALLARTLQSSAFYQQTLLSLQEDPT